MLLHYTKDRLVVLLPGQIIWSCIRVKTVRKSIESNSRSDLMTNVLIDAFVMLALLLISS